MFIAHIPSGYIVTKKLWTKIAASHISKKWLFFWGILGSFAPDLDLLYFYLIDGRQHHHHSYFTHYPIIWFSCLLIACVCYRLMSFKYKHISIYAILFFGMGCIHLLLDTVVGDIWWFAPFIDQPFALATVPAKLKPWWLNFIVHWSFLIEIGITAYAIFLWRKSKRTSKQASQT